jgi:hypothetical protein
VLFERIPREDLDEAVQKIDAMAMPGDAKPYPQLRKRWRRAKPLFFQIATRVQTAAAPNGEPVREAVEYLKGVPNWTDAPMHDAPTAAIPKPWRPYVLDESERAPIRRPTSSPSSMRGARRSNVAMFSPNPERVTGIRGGGSWRAPRGLPRSRWCAGRSIAPSMPTSKSRA